MTNITAAMVKELRETTSAGMLDCKKALTETNGDMEQAIDWLRKKGLASAAKKASRIAAEGLVAVAVDGNKGAVVEVNSETDFVAKNEIFQEYVEDAAQVALMYKRLHWELKRKSDFWMEKGSFFFSRMTIAHTTLTACAKTVARAAPAASR